MLGKLSFGILIVLMVIAVKNAVLAVLFMWFSPSGAGESGIDFLQ